MQNPLFKAICCSLLLCLLAHPAAAHNGKVALVYPVEGITIDGDLSDWPQDLPHYPIASHPHHELTLENINTAQDTQDFEAFFWAGYNADENALYLAVEVQDQSIVAAKKYGWGLNDIGVTAFDLHHSREYAPLHAYAISGISPLYKMLGPSSTSPDQVRATLKQDATRQYYEWRFDMGQFGEELSPLQPGMVLGFETAIYDVDADTSTTYSYWGPEGQVFGGTNLRLGDLLLLGESEHTGFLQGQIRWPDGTGAGRIKIEVQAIDKPASWLQIKTDRTGQFSTPLPPGQYRVKALHQEREIAISSGDTSSLELKGRAALGQSVLAGAGKATRAGRGLMRGKWRSWDASDGLTDETIMAIAQDRDGAMWFGTGFGPATSQGKGLVRYDGEQYTHFAAKDGFTAGNILALAEDQNGHIWIGANKGLVRYDGEHFTTYTIADGLPADYVLSLFVQQDGSLWIGTVGGVARYDGEKFTNFTEEDGLPANTVVDITEDRAGGLWLAASGLARYDGKTWHTIPEGADWVSNNFNGLEIDMRGHIWVAASDGVLRYDGDQWQTVFTDSVRTYNAKAHWWKIALEDDQGRPWLISGNQGIKRLDGETWTHFDASNTPVGDHLMAAYKDREGRIWFANKGGGISYYDEQFAYTYTKADGLPDNVVMTVFEDRAGKIWFGTGSGLAHFENDVIVHDLPEITTSIWSLREDPQDGLWFTSTGRGLVYYNGSEVVNYTKADGLADDFPTEVLPDSQGHVWVRYFFGYLGVSRYDGEKWQTFTAADGLGMKIGGAQNRIAEDRAGQIWFGTGSGLNRFDGERFTLFTQDDGLPHDQASGLVVDPNGDLWFGFAEGGFARYYSPSPGDTTPRFDLYDLEQEYTTGTFSGETFDDRGHLWLGSWGGGVMRFDGLVFQRLRRHHGLSSSSIQDITQTRDGAVWIAHEKGATRYMPRHTQPTLDLRNVVADETHGPIAEIALSSTQDYLHFEFQGASLNTASEDFVYVYRLEGYQDEWQQINANRVEFHDLPIGEYRFEVKAVDHDLNYSEPATVAVQIHLPYERIGWISSLALALFLVVWQGGRVVRRDRALRQSNRQLEQQTDDLEKARHTAEEAQGAAQAANHAKSLFLANMSHEIRTPMNAILGYAQILQRSEDLPTSQHKAVSTIQSSGDHLLKLINNVLDISKIEAGRMELQLGEFDLQNLVTTVSTMFELQCREKGLGWTLANLPETRVLVRGDEGKLQQILINLLGNAYKFTDEGQVSLHVHSPSANRYHFEVIDTGPGISPADQKTLFQAFQQGESGHQRGGTGLGLTISQKQLALMDSQLELESNIGQGSRFFFAVELPPAEGVVQSIAAQDYQHVQHLASGHAADILITDDVAENREILQSMLSDIGCSVRTAAHGREALDQIERAQPDLVFMDIRMPVLGGVETLKLIREKDDWNQIKIVAISASVFDHEREHYLEAGFDAFIDKPFRFEWVCQHMAQLLGVEYEYATASQPEHMSADWNDLHLPTELHDRLREAAELYSVTEIEGYLDEVSQVSAEHGPLASHLRHLNQEQDMDGILSILAEIGRE